MCSGIIMVFQPVLQYVLYRSVANMPSRKTIEDPLPWILKVFSYMHSVLIMK